MRVVVASCSTAEQNLAAARARGRVGGHPKKDAAAIKDAMAMYDSKQYTVKEIKERTGVGRTTLYAYLGERKEKGDNLVEESGR